ncbi:EscU/YscU/HrcU family type III secretion system export apparatus switch protein [Caldicellulosiruptoraceae bacterium PP1]
MNKKFKAVALRYKSGEYAPKVIAKGQGYTANRIIEESKKYNIKTYQDPQLTEQLYKLDINQFIPEDLFETVAQILIYIGYLDNKKN